MKILLNWVLSVVILIFCFSCKKGGTTEPVPIPDTSVPGISLIDPTPGKSFVLGATIHLLMDLSDNVELKSYQVVISKSLKGLVTSDWAYDHTWTIPAGKKTFSVNHNEIVVPLTVTGNQTTTGNYDVAISCFDTSNNKTTTNLTIVLTK